MKQFKGLKNTKGKTFLAGANDNSALVISHLSFNVLILLILAVPVSVGFGQPQAQMEKLRIGAIETAGNQTLTAAKILSKVRSRLTLAGDWRIRPSDQSGTLAECPVAFWPEMSWTPHALIGQSVLPR